MASVSAARAYLKTEGEFAGVPMANLIPHFIHERFVRQEWEGAFEAASLFVDVSGFTALTELLMQHARDGAEVLTAALNRIMGPLVAETHARGGWIPAFAGDAFTALFPYTGDAQLAYAQALHTALFIRDFFQQQGRITTRYGQFDLGFRVGLSGGATRWGILGSGQRHAFYVHGPAVTGCGEVEACAPVGGVVADPAIAPRLAAMVTLLPHTCPPLLGVPTALPALSRHTPTPALPQQACAPFVLDSAIDLIFSGGNAEFRQVVSVFISFDPSHAAATWAPFVSAVLDVANGYGGYFNKLNFSDKGPMMLLLFGAPVAHEDDLARATAALLTLRELTAGSEVRWRAGLTYDMVYAGFVGGMERGEYTAIGNAVNLASRLTTQAAWGEILLNARAAQDTARGSPLRVECLGALTYKGFAAAQLTYRLLGDALGETAFFEPPLIGREAELAQLVAAAAPLSEGRFAGVVYLCGEAGIGKSHLSYELFRTLARQGPVTWLTAQTDQILRQAFNPFTYFLKRYFNQLPDATAEENQACFEARLQQLLERLAEQRSLPGRVESPAQCSAELRRVQSVLGALLGLHWRGSLYESLDGALRYQNTLFALKTLLLAEATLNPVVLHLEDAHALDPASHDVITTLCRNVAHYPLLILMTGRTLDDGTRPTLTLPEEVPFKTFDLNVLSPDGLRQLSETVLGGPVDAALCDLLLARTQANPFFVQQFLYYFRESGLLSRDSAGVWRAQAELSPEVPTTINAILVARLDRLAPSVKEVIKAAAVLGREFDARILEYMFAADITGEVRVAEQEQIWSKVE